MARKPIDATVTDAVASTQNIAEVLATVTDLTRAARAAANLSVQLYAAAERSKTS
jgi:pilus assembly protein TadC